MNYVQNSTATFQTNIYSLISTQMKLQWMYSKTSEMITNNIFNLIYPNNKILINYMGLHK